MWLTRSSLVLTVLGVLIFQALLLQAKKDGPKIKKTTLDNPPANLFYFTDSDTILIHDAEDGRVLRSDDAGESWEPVKEIGKGEAWDLWQHPYDNKVAYVLGMENTHWITKNQGKSWASFETEKSPSRFRPPFSFHAEDSDKVILHQAVCHSIFSCDESTSYTTDGFEKLHSLRGDTRGCVFAHSTPLFQTSDDDKDDNRIICVAMGRYSSFSTDKRLVVSDNFFEDETEPYLEAGRTVQGIISIAVVKGFLVAAAKSAGTDELALYVTQDAEQWHRAIFPSDHRVDEDAYTVLESTNYSIQVDVMTTMVTNPMGVLFTSNSNGTYFTRNVEHTNRDSRGIVDFEKVQGIQGIVLVNIVDNWKEVEGKSSTKKKLRSQISFDDGRTFNNLKFDDKDLHLHSMTEISNVGRIFSSPAPGLVMGVGNTGKYLMDYEEGDLYVSDDAGLTWRKALSEAHKYEFGDQGSILVAIYDEGPTDKISYSIDHGQNWSKADLPAEIRAKVLTTIADSTSLKFILLGTTGRGEDAKNVVLALDFDGLHERRCKDDDFEVWNARVDENQEAICIMGAKQSYRRRKPSAVCFVDEEFRDPVPEFDPCPCTEEDFECDFNFIRSKGGKDCVPAGRMPVPSGACAKEGDKYKGSSGFRLIAGNQCVRKGGVELDKEVERDCKETAKPPVSGEVTNEPTSFHASAFKEYYYLERTESSEGDDETVVMLTDEFEVYITKDHGKTWDGIPDLKGETITDIYPHQYFNDVVFFLTGGKEVFYSINRGETIGKFKAPDGPRTDKLPTLTFHPNHKDWLIWIGAKNCGFGKGECHNVASYSEDRGDHWETLSRYVRKCEFIKEEGRGQSKNLVYCEHYKDEKIGNPLELRSSENWFADSTLHFDDIIDFATMSEFIVVAAKAEDQQSLQVDASVDGKTFADAKFPSNFNPPVQKAYTVLDSSTHAVFMHVTVSNREKFEYGSIVKSNSNGTSYVLSLHGVNRDTRGYVDFEKMLVLEGVAVVNVVENIEDAEAGIPKKLKTLITHNDGAQWSLVRAPEKDAEDHDYGCDVTNIEKCSLHLHGYTERRDPRDMFSSPSAIGMMMGVGNVGEFLNRKADGDTFITRDGGFQWHAVKKGNYMWEYGDQGSIIVIVEENVATDIIFYSKDEGETWQQYQFTDSKMEISSISTVPSDNSRNFLLWGKEADKDGEIKTVNLDFTGLWDRQCKLDDDNPIGDDYTLWEPKHPFQKDKCLFGHIAQYHRKQPGQDCYNGRSIQHLHNIARNCSCTRADFEWYVNPALQCVTETQTSCSHAYLVTTTTKPQMTVLANSSRASTLPTTPKRVKTTRT